MHVPVSPEINAMIDQAAEISIRRNQLYVGVDHLFEAILSQSSKLPRAFGDKHIQSLHKAARELAREQWPADAMVSVAGEVFYTPRCAAIATEATRLAQRLGEATPSTGHLLLAILADAHAGPSRAIDRLRLDRGALIEELRRALTPHATTAQSRSTHAPEPAAKPRREPKTAQAAQENESEPRESSSVSLEHLTRNLTALARRGTLGPAIGRDKEMFSLLEVLGRQGKNNAILVGEAGVGKTRIVEGLAVMATTKAGEGFLKGQRILELNLAALMSGTQYRGAFEERLTRLLDDLKRSKDTILFIDEIHLIMGAGATEGSGLDMANLLKPALSRGEIRCIGATTLQEYRKFIEKDPAIERRFQMVRIDPLSEPATFEVLTFLKPSLERHHGTRISDRALHAAIALTQRYMPNRQLPDKAIDVLDQACARHRLKAIAMKYKPGLFDSDSGFAQVNKVTPHDIRKVVSRIAGVPIEEITAEERLRLGHLERRLKRRIIGQDEAIARTVAAVKRARAGLGDPSRPDAVLLFLGPTGVGKTELAKALAEQLFGSADHLITFDMSEYLESHSVSKLIGAPPGYVGHGEEGRLTGAVRNKPFSILLFDEIEKAHPRVFDIFLPMLDEGRVKDSNGRDVSFKHCIILFTSNIAADLLQRSGGHANRPQVMDALRKHFRPEFINRIDEIVPFHPLLFDDIRAILSLSIRQLGQRLADKGFGVRMYQGAYEHLAEVGYDPEYGARELRRAVERYIIDPISELILAGTFQPGDLIEALMVNGKLTFRKGEPRPKTEKERAR